MKLVYSLLTFLVSAACFSQVNFEEGYYIDNGGAVVKCLIRNLEWENSPVTIEYKASENDAPQVKYMSDISEFGVGNVYKFKRYKVDIDRSNKYGEWLSENPDPRWSVETVFLKVLVEGQLTLYRYEENNFVKYFYAKGTDIPKQLVYKEYRVQEKVKENTLYRKQLYELMKDKFSDLKRFLKLDYHKTDLVKLFKEYNGQDENAVNFVDRQTNSDFNLRLKAGVSQASVSTSGPIYNVDDYTYDSKTVYLFGAELEFVLPFNNNKWSLFIDPRYYKYENSGDNKGAASYVKLQLIDLPIGARYYMFLNNKTTLFVNAAYNIGITLGNSEIQMNPYIAANEVQNGSNFSLGAGVTFDRFTVEARYDMKRELLKNYVSLAADYDSWGIIVGYKLF